MNDRRDILAEINNAVLDLQSADYQSYSLPLQRLGRLLQHESLQEVNEELAKDVDLDAFLEAAETDRGMRGSSRLNWPHDDSKILGIQLKLAQKFADNPKYMLEFAMEFYYSGSKYNANLNAIVGKLLVPFAREYKTYVVTRGTKEMAVIRPLGKRIFIVHGHDGEARETVARFLGNIGFQPIILHEQASRGRTVIEKVEANADVGFAVVLLTPDDLGKARNADHLEPRARQNVLLELGYFMARLGRENVCALKKGHVEIPSDFAGVVWEEMDDRGGWKTSLARELQAAGHDIDWNAVMR